MAEIIELPRQSLVLKKRIVPEAQPKPNYSNEAARLIRPLKFLGLITQSNDDQIGQRLEEESTHLLDLGIPGDLYVELAVGPRVNAMGFSELFSPIDVNVVGISSTSPAIRMDGDAILDPAYRWGWAAHLRLATHQADGSDLYYTGHRFDDNVGHPDDDTQQALFAADKDAFEKEFRGYNMSDVNAPGHCVRFLTRYLDNRHTGERTEYLSHGAARVVSLGRAATNGHGFRVDQTREVATYIKHGGGQLWIGHDNGKAKKNVGICKSIGRDSSDF